MGFYGNITNNAKTQFQFDRIYPNRYQMDRLAKSDDIYIGRYVLIEYDSEKSYSKDDFQRIWVDNQGYGYQDVNKSIALTSGTCKVGDMFIVPEDDYLTDLEEIYNSTHYIYKVIETTSTSAKLEKVTESSDTNYTKNYNIDISNYGQGRGYDSTVWQKVYVENTEKYVMIAELNSVVPTFDVVADAPTLAPLAPHFDTSSTDVYYKLHWQPAWGLRVAQASGVPSDESVTHSSINKDTLEETTTSVAGQIYYNKNGFNPDVRTYNSSIENSIKVTPTGKSGEKYYNHKTGQMTVQNDIQEISINLPAIGNAVSDFWDVMYGQVRNKDIDWDSYAGLRLVGNQESGGFSYNTKNVSTVAGAINSVHDLMGMIIEAGNLTDKNGENYINITNASTAKIYYNEENDRYYRKSIDYSYEEADVGYRLVTVTEETYAPGLYYTKDASGNYNPALGVFESQNYYEKYLLNNDSIYSKINKLIDYASNAFYALENQDYILSSGDTFELGRNYYKVSLDNLRSVIPYEQYKYYRKDDAGKWISDEAYVINQNYYTIQSNNSNELYAYVPNAWLYLKDGQIPVIDDSLEITSGREYYHWSIKQDEYGNTTFEVQGQPVNVVAYNKNIHFQYDKDAKTYNPILGELTAENCRTSEFQFCEITVNLIEDEFYVKDKYYYLDSVTKNILLDTSNKYTENRKYYYPTVEQVYFYREYYYYYIDTTTQEYVLDGNSKVTAGRTYYEKNPYYIINDTSRVFEIGAPWNSNVIRIPCAITLGIRTVDYEWKELEGFARDLNTIHGLILKINQIVEWNNNQTRDLETVQGCINTINDLVNKINDLIPGQFVITNAYGQLSPADWTTDSWLQVKVNEETDNIDFQHIGPIKTDKIAEENETPLFGGSFKIPLLSWDDRGHIYEDSNSTRTIVLPLPSLNDFTADGHSVLTGISMNDSTGAITQTNAYVGNLTLTGYNNELSNSNSQVWNSDSINTAFGKLQVQMNEEVSRAKTEEQKLQSNITAEENRAKTAEQANAAAIVSEQERAKAAEQANANAIITEQNRAKEAEKVNADAINVLNTQIENLDLEKYDAETQFSWGYVKEEQEEIINTVKNEDGSTTNTIQTTVSYIEQTKTLQEILTEIREALNLHLIGEDNGQISTREEIVQ